VTEKYESSAPKIRKAQLQSRVGFLAHYTPVILALDSVNINMAIKPV